MALGPKAMGDAIVANLKLKTGKDLNAWLAALERLKPTDKKDATAKLKAAGLGPFQAVTVAEHFFGGSAYIAPDGLVDDLFAKHPEQRALFDVVCDQIVDGKQLRLQPCKNYMPIYSAQNIIVASFKPTARGLYLGLRGSDFGFETVPHKRSLGGSDAMQVGIYPETAASAIQAIRAALTKG
jgi:hypothetical protein